MTFNELKTICGKITCDKMRCRATKQGRNVLIETWNNGLDKDFEFKESTSLFELTDEHMFPLTYLKDMDLNCVLEIVRNMMFNITVHEFNEYFKYDKVTVQSPHIAFKV